MFNLELLAQAERYRAEQAERDRQWRKEDRWSGFCMLVVAAAVGAASVVATLIASGKMAWY